MKRGLGSIIIVIAVILVLGAMMVLPNYNSLVTLDEDVRGKWSQIDNQLQRRADLIPNLVNTVKGYAAHEEKIFTEVSKAREKLIGAGSVSEKAEAHGELSGALSRLLAIVENYPQLKADAGFQRLSDELAGTENRIATARMDYNNAVQTYNGKVRRFPTALVARMFGFEQKDYFKVEEGAKQVPSVDFGSKESGSDGK